MTVKTESLSVEKAEAALQAAKTAHEELRERLIAGDDDVTDRDVAEADDAVVFAELKLEAAHEAARRREQQQRDKLAEQLQRDAERLTEPDARKAVRKAAAQTVDALDRLFIVCADLNDRRTDLEHQADELDVNVTLPRWAEPIAIAVQVLCDVTDRHGGPMVVDRRGDLYLRLRALGPPPGSPPRLDATPEDDHA